MKKALYISVVFSFVIVVIGYLLLMTALESSIMLDISDHVQILPVENEIVLPWYLRIGTQPDIRFSGTNGDGQFCTLFCYTLPEIFESAEMHCIVCWESGEAVAYIGESKGLDVFGTAFFPIQSE